MEQPTQMGALEPVPKGQDIFDNIWLWLALGIGMPTIFYIGWALVDLYLLVQV